MRLGKKIRNGMTCILVLRPDRFGGSGMLDVAGFTRKPAQLLVKSAGSFGYFYAFMSRVGGGVTEARGENFTGK